MLKINIPENWAEKPPPPGTGKIFLDWIYPFHAISQLWFSWQNSHPPRNRDFFWTGSIHFMQFQATFGFRWQKSPPFFSAFL